MESLYKTNRWFFTILLAFTIANGQDQIARSVTHLKIKLQKTTIGTTKINIFNEIVSTYIYSNLREGLEFETKTLALAQKKQWEKRISEANENIGFCNHTLFNYTEPLNYLQKAFQLHRQSRNNAKLSGTLKNIALVYLSQKKYREAISNFEKGLKINQTLNKKTIIIYNLNDVANAY